MSFWKRWYIALLFWGAPALARKKIVRRTYFRAADVARVLDEENHVKATGHE